MVDRKKEKGHADTGLFQQKDVKDCPVCGRPLHKDNLVDMKSIVEDVLYDIDGVRLVGCTVRLECDCEHRVDEEGFTLDEPHNLVAVVTVEFDETGNCVQFAITEIRVKR